MTTQQPRFGSPNDSGRRERGAAYAGMGTAVAGGSAYAFGRGQRRMGMSAQEAGTQRYHAGTDGAKKIMDEAQRASATGKVDGRSKTGRQLKGFKAEIEAGRSQYFSGSKMVSRSKPYRIGGLAALAAGAGLLGAGVIGSDRARAKSLRPRKSNVTSMDEYRNKAAQASGGFVAQADGKARQGYHDPAPKPVDDKMRAYFERNGMLADGASEADVQALARRMRENGR